jgi:cytochrome c oxidase assembly protein subunit 11
MKVNYTIQILNKELNKLERLFFINKSNLKIRIGSINHKKFTTTNFHLMFPKYHKKNQKTLLNLSNKYFSELTNKSASNKITKDSEEKNIIENEEDNFFKNFNADISPSEIKIYSRKKIENTNSEINFTQTNIDISNNQNQMVNINEEDGIKPLTEEDLILDPNSPTYLEDMKKLPRTIQHIEFHKHLMLKRKKAETKRLYNQRVLFALGILLIGLFVFWVPLYRAVCEHAGFLVKTSVSDYKDYNKTINLGRKFKVNFESLVDDDLDWEFFPEQKFVYVNAGETCLIFYKARNKTNNPIVGLSVYDVHPQSCALYFNKVQCFCFENQMLGPNEEVDLPVLFYLDPSIQEDKYVIDYGHYDLNLKYTFYYAKKQELAKIMKKRLTEEKELEEELNKRKSDLNTKYGYEKYLIEENKSTLPGVNPLLRDFKISEI